MIWGTFESEEHRIMREKMEKFMNGRNAEAGTYNGEPTFCTVNGYGACPYCDQGGICHINDPMTDCEDFAVFFQNDWSMWLALDDTEGIDWEAFDGDMGFDPYLGAYSFDC